MTKNAAHLYDSFQPAHYDLTLTPDIATKKLTGTVTITGKKSGRPSQRITFHQKKLKIVSATITRHDKKGSQTFEVARINHQRSMDEVRLHVDSLLYAGAYTITMEFEGEIQPGMTGVYLSTYQLNGQPQTIISTQFESHYARLAFPCIDEPAAKATFDLTVITPGTKGEAVLGNTPIKKQEKLPEGEDRLATTFETTPKVPTYLLAFVVGELQNKSVKTKSGVEVSVWATKAHTEASLDFALDVAKRCIEFFEDFYGTPYPLPKSDHVAIPDFAAAGMENWGLITYREFAVLIDPETAPQSSKELVAEVVAHEVSHQWFGDLVTMKWWDNLWLNESFANVMAFVAIDDLFPSWKIWDNYVADDGLAAIRRDSIAGVQSIKTAVHHPDEINSIFDPSIVYAKGGRLINMLMQYLGRKDFCKGLKTYFAKHAYGNTTGDDLWAALGEASGKDVASLMNPWLERSGFPAIKVQQTGKQLNVSQSHFLLDPAKADHDRIWPIPLLSDDQGVPTMLSTISVDVDLKSDNYVRLNKGAMGHYIVQYVQPEHTTALAALVASKKLAEAERLMLLSDSSMLARGGEQSFVATLNLLRSYAKEDSESVWGMIAVTLADLRRFVDIDEALEEPIKALIRGLIAPEFERLGWEEKPDESPQDTKQRATIIGLGVYADHKPLLSHALELFEAYKKDTKAVPAELRGIVFGAAVRQATKGAFTYLLDLEASTQNVDLQQEILAALTLTRSQSEAKTLLGRLKDSTKVRQHDIDRWLVYLLRNRYTRDLAWDWMRANWPWIEEVFAEETHYDYYPRYAAASLNSRKHLAEYREFFGPKQTQTALARNIAMGIEELENRLDWLERDLAAITEFFA